MVNKIIDSYINGRKEQAYKQFKKLSLSEQQGFIDFIKDNTGWYDKYILAYFLQQEM